MMLNMVQHNIMQHQSTQMACNTEQTKHTIYIKHLPLIRSCVLNSLHLAPQTVESAAPNPSQNKQSSEREKKKIRKKLDQDRAVSNTEKDQIESVKI